MQKLFLLPPLVPFPPSFFLSNYPMPFFFLLSLSFRLSSPFSFHFFLSFCFSFPLLTLPPLMCTFPFSLFFTPCWLILEAPFPKLWHILSVSLKNSWRILFFLSCFMYVTPLSLEPRRCSNLYFYFCLLPQLSPSLRLLHVCNIFLLIILS